MNVITDNRANIEIFYQDEQFCFQHEGKKFVCQSMDKVHEFFQNRSFDTVKLCQNGENSYLHFGLNDKEYFDSKKSLRKTLSQESCGVWIEEKDNKARYFVDASGWFTTSYHEVSKKECFEKLGATSTLTKILGISLGLLNLLPGSLEMMRHFPFGPRETGMSLLSIQQKSPLLGALGLSLLPNSVKAQPMGTEFQVNNYTASDQRFPEVAPLNDGGFVVVWMSNGQDGSGNGVYMQRYDNSSMPYGVEYQVNTYQAEGQYLPNIAPLSNGGFVITWISASQDANLAGIYGQRYDSNSIAVGSEFRINTYQSNHQDFHSVTALINGDFVVTWQSLGQDGDGYGIFGQRYTMDGTPLDTEFQINTYTTSNQWNPSVANLNNGGFLATWQSFGQDGDLDGIFGQRYDNTGLKISSEFRINTYTTSNQKSPSTASLKNGDFVVTWVSNGQDGSNDGVFGQRYDIAGNQVGSEFQVNTHTTGSQYSPSITGLNDGGFAITWEGSGQDGSSNGIFGQRYDSGSNRIGSEFQVNTYTVQGQYEPSIAALKDGGFVIVWESYLQEGDGYGIFGQRYDINGTAVGLPTLTSMSSSPPPATTTSVTRGSSQASSTNTLRTSSMQPSSIAPNLPTTSTSMTRASSQASSTNTLRNSSTIPSLLGSSSSKIESTPLSLSSAPSTQANSSSQSSSALLNNKPNSSEPSQATLSSFSSSTSRSSELGIPVIDDIVYHQTYFIISDGQPVGTFTVSGGSGLVDKCNTNIISIQLDYQPEEGDVLTLFEILQEEEGNCTFQAIEIETAGLECIEGQGGVETNPSGGSSYNVIFKVRDSCAASGPKILAGAISIVAN